MRGVTGDPRGVANLRDLGGIAIAAGVIQPRRLLRSAAPARFSHATRRQVEAVAPGAIADLRSAVEQAGTPTIILPNARRIPTGTAGDSHVGDPAGFAAACSVSAAATRQAIHGIYAAIPAAHAAAYAALFAALAAGELPLLVHCAVGKDRTGAAIAILLAALGASPAAIEADYLASNAHHAEIAAAFAADPRTAAIRAAPAAVWAPLLRAERDYLDALFDALAAGGGARAYVERSVGAAGLARIGAWLVESAQEPPAAGAH